MKIAIITDYNNKTWVWSQNYNLYIWFRRLWIEADIINLVSLQWFKEIPAYGTNIISRVFGNPLLSFAYGVFYKFPRVLKKILAKEKYDAVILGHQWMAYLSKSLSRLPVKLSIVVDDLFPLYDYVHGFGFFLYNHVLLAGLSKIKNMVFISDFTKEDYVKFYANLSTKKYATIPIWIDTIETPLDVQNALIDRWHLSGKRIILNVGSEDPRKNINMFLELARHYQEHKDMIFIRVGRKSQESLAYITQHGLDNVLYVSGLSEEELMSLYRISNIVVSPSLLEGYGKQIFEGYLYHNFVVSTKVSDVESLFKWDASVFMINDPLALGEYVDAIDMICKNNLSFHYLTKVQSLEKEAQEYLDFLKNI